MKETVDRILQEEEKARKKIKQAQLQAETIVLSAQDRSRDLIEKAVHAAEKEAAEKKEESERKFLTNKEKILKEILEKSSLSRAGKEKDIIKKAHDVFSGVITIKD